jgi:hypothetical protein
MSDRDPVSVLLPTIEWNTACEQVAAQLAPEDELLVICDTETDPVASHEPPENVEILIAGEPEGCSGKANALAHGMATARHDRFVWTDNDFNRDLGWLDRLVAAGETHGPATAVPFFTGGGWWRPFEPWYGALFAFLVCLQLGRVEDTAWGGGVVFTRSELTVPVSEFVAELREVLSDDYLLTQRLPHVHAVRSMVTHVEVPGDARSVRHRLVRFTRIGGVNGRWLPGIVLSVAFLAGGVLFPLGAAVAVTAGFAAVYARFGLGRVNVLYAYPGLLLLPIVIIVAAGINEFEWTGRRYRFPNSGEVEILDSAESATHP